MRKIVIILLSLSMSFASEKNIQNQMDGLMRFLQYKYQISGPEDLHKLDSKRHSTLSQTNSNRDMSDLVGDWSLEYQDVGINVTVGTDQTVPMAEDMMALDSANGVITASHNDFETGLVYLLDDSYMGGGGGYYDYYRSRDCLFLEIEDTTCEGTYNVSWAVTDAWGDTVDYSWFDSCPDESWDICLDEGDYTFHCAGNGDDTTDYETSWTLYDEDYNIVGTGGVGDSLEFYLDDSGGGEDGGGITLMNLDLMGFMMMMFGMPPEGVENPMMVMIAPEDDMVTAQTFTFLDDSVSTSIFFGSMESSVSIDSTNYSISMDSLVLSDPYGGSGELLLNGTLAPDMMDLIAGVEAEILIPGLLLDGELEELRVVFNEDSTGMDIGSDIEPYYGIAEEDTSYFTWYASNDSLYMITEEYDDYYYDNYIDTTVLAYMFDGDTLFFSQMFYPCEYYDYEYYEDCINEIDDEMISMLLAGVQDIEELYQYMEYAFIPTQMVSIEEGGAILPNSLTLHPAYPNPFNPVTNIRFDVGLEIKDLTTLKVFDIRGQNIATLANGYYTAGTHEVRWDASEMASGIYFTELISGSFRNTQKIILLK